jgi:PAS domain S-box-containing protein
MPVTSNANDTPDASVTTPAAAARPAGRLRRMLMHGETIIASSGIALAALLLASMSATAYWTTREQAVSAEQAENDRVRSLAISLAPGTETLLSSDDLSVVRRIISETAMNQSLTRCRILLPDGQVLAAAPGTDKVTAIKLPVKWSEKAPPVIGDPTPGIVSYSQPLIVPHRGVAFLQLSAMVPDQTDRRISIVTGVGAIGAAAMLVLLLVYRRVRGRLAAISAVRSALLEMYPSGCDVSTVRASAGNLVSPDLGPEAIAWNALVSEREQARKEAMADKTRQSLGRRRQANGDLDAACDAMTQGLILIDDQGKVKYANGAAAAFVRMDREKLLGSSITSAIKVDKVQAAIKEIMLGTLRRRAVIDVERKKPATPNDAGKSDPNSAATGTGVLRFSLRPVRREDSASGMIIIEDITQQKAAEEARHAFVAQATHELRTPLTNIRLYVETAIEDGDNDPAIRTQALNVINGETRRLERIVSEMLSVAEIEAGSFKLKQGDVRIDAMFEELKHDYQQQAQEKKITLTFLLPPKFPVLTGDREKVAIALHNLVGNALKYTNTGGSVTVRVDANEQQLTVAVADTGIGISQEDAARIFERFYRASDKRVERITGTGLGLTIAREVARLHGGDITVESQLDHGSTFTLTLPVKAAA